MAGCLTEKSKWTRHILAEEEKANEDEELQEKCLEFLRETGQYGSNQSKTFIIT
jgi:hypothetical protein